MIDVPEFQRWVATLEKQNNVAIDDGGLTILEVDPNGNPTGAYCEVGGVPLTDKEEEEMFGD